MASSHAATWGRWLLRLTKSSCMSGRMRKGAQPTPFQRFCATRTALAEEAGVGVIKQIAFSKRSGRAAVTPVCSEH